MGDGFHILTNPVKRRTPAWRSFMKLLIISLSVLIAVGAVTGLTLVYLQRQATGLPDNSPAAYLGSKENDPQKQIVVLLGDSLTHGSASANYVDALADKLEKKKPNAYTVINAGVNSQFAYNAALRIDEVIKCSPDFVFVLIGTNDLNALLIPETLSRAMKEQSLPQIPDAEWYLKNLGIIARRLQSETSSQIAFLSLPPIGEDPSHPAYKMSREYSLIVKTAADHFGVSYLPLFETMDAYLERNPGSPKYDHSTTRSLMMKSVAKHYLLGSTWNQIGESNGFRLHTDFLHLNETGAGIVADIVAGSILGLSMEEGT